MYFDYGTIIFPWEESVTHKLKKLESPSRQTSLVLNWTFSSDELKKKIQSESIKIQLNMCQSNL